MEYPILSKIKSPEDVKALPQSSLDQLCEEIRSCIIETVSKNGGHLASNLGAVELTVALHRAFSSPKDAIIFDVGHQSYTHKLLTGRFNKFSTLRTENGISGFMRPQESIHDPFVTGHSSNSISAAYGIYKAKRLMGEDGTAVAVIGDGAMTGGMAYEALNNSGGGRSNFIVVLNDNKMSISRNVGAIARTLTKLRNRPRYHHFKYAISRFLLAIPVIGKPLNGFIYSVKETFKNIVYKSNVFAVLGFNYLGPVDGHNISEMESLFKVAKEYNRPSLVHVITTKGKGYHFAESSPKNYHGVSPFDIEEGAVCGSNLNFSKVAGNTLCELAAKDKTICAITAAMTEGTGLSDFAREYKQNFFDVGIAEQHAVTFAAGLAKQGLKPFFVVYSSFLQRGFDQIIHDMAIGGLPVRLLIDRAGIVGEDGETHQGIFDVSYLTSVPGIQIYSPGSYKELEYRIKYVAENDGMFAVRYPRGCEKPSMDVDFTGDYTLIPGNCEKVIVTYGRLFSESVAAREVERDVNIIKLNKIYPLSEEIIQKISEFKEIYVFEETVKNGGIGEHLASALLERGYKGKFSINAVPNVFVPMAEISSALKKYKLDSLAMINKIRGEENA
ncbi:MAG: 1-deoxy-D-xylulose-5-phosphate synthase [Acutalibacteraceae bacterium]